MKTINGLSRQTKQFIASSADALFLPLVFVCALWLRFEELDTVLLHRYALTMFMVPIISLPLFAMLGLYRVVVRAMDHRILAVTAIGTSLAALAIAAFAFMTMEGVVSRGLLVIYFAGSLLYMTASRLLTRAYILTATRPDKPVRVVIYGAGNAGLQLASALKASREYLPVAFVDDKLELQRTTIRGLRVWSPYALQDLVQRYDVEEVLLAMPSVSKVRQRDVLMQLESLKIKIKVTPPIVTMLERELNTSDVRDIQIEDLLGRDSVTPDPRLLGKCITGKTVMISGAGGSIGSELCRQIIRLAPERMVLLELSEFGLYTVEQELQEINKELTEKVELLPFLGSVLEYEKCVRIMSTFAVDSVYHAAAYKHVPLVEHNPIEGVRNNSLGTMQMAQAAVDAGVSCFVLVSTDKAVRPTNVMGATKRLAELVLQGYARKQSKTRFTMVRFGNVLGSSGSVVPLFKKQILAGGPITLTHPEITRYFMTIPEAAQLVIQAGSMGNGGDVFVLDMGEPVKIADLAKRMVHLSGLSLKSESDTPEAIDIIHIGLRPGEKLYEELLIGENVERTSHPLIMRAREEELSWDELCSLIDRIEAACDCFDFETLLSLLGAAVKEYRPQCVQEDLLWFYLQQQTMQKIFESRAVSFA